MSSGSTLLHRNVSRRKDESLQGDPLTRRDFLARGLAISLPWFTLVNISFALMILLRNPLFNEIDLQYHLVPGIGLLLDGAMISIIPLFAVALFLALRRQRGLCFPMLLSGLIWAVCCYAFIAVLRLPFAWPLCTILLLTAMAALYFHPQGLLCVALPIWLTMPVASVALNQGVRVNFFISWLIFTVILVYGRTILLRWFEEAWQRMRENQLLIARLDALAHQDPLTETANRRAMESVLESAISQQKVFALIMLDVDFFKRYNDHYGHPAGDACLTRVAQALKQSVRHPDDLVSRYGGEEFVVVLFNATEKNAQQVAERIQENLRDNAIAHAGSTVSDNVTVSMGIACFAAGQTASEVIAQADAALYRAKEAGRNRWSC